MSVTRSDIPAIAALLAEAGARLGQTVTRDGQEMPAGEAAWHAANDYIAGPRAAVADPAGRGNRWETDSSGEVWPVPADATGDAATTTDPTSLLLVRYRTLLDWLQDNSGDLVRMLGDLLPMQPHLEPGTCVTCGAPHPKLRSSRTEPTTVAAEGWCVSCYRDDQHLQPREVDRNGHHYHAHLCRWCAAFRNEHGIDPPLPVLRVRHQAKRVTLALVQQHCSHCRQSCRADRPANRGWRRRPRAS